MPIIVLIAVLLVLILIYAPSLWVKHKLRQHAAERPDLLGTGGELAQHLVERASLDNVKIEETEEGMDHYDPVNRIIRLSRSYYNGKSISAVAVAAHEFGHALQHARGEKMFFARMAFIKAFNPINKIIGFLLVIGPLISLLIRAPTLSLVFLALAVFTLISEFIVHLITLPVEFDASFGKALPILSNGNYLNEDDIPAARAVLRAAAFTYVASALAGIFNILRFLRILR